MVYTFVWLRGQNFGLGHLTYGLGLERLLWALRLKLYHCQTFGLIWPQGQSLASPGLDNKSLASVSA